MLKKRETFGHEKAEFVELPFRRISVLGVLERERKTTIIQGKK